MVAQLSPIVVLLKIITHIFIAAKYHGLKRGSEEVPSTVTIKSGRSSSAESFLLILLSLVIRV
jgi:hypothetical protein